MSPQSRRRKPQTRKRPAPRASGRVADDDEFIRRALTPRYTPPAVHIRIRPTRHKVLGWFQVGAGLLLVLVNYAEELGARVLPGGHNELYFVLGLVIAGGGTWWLGIFDRPTKVDPSARHK